MPVTLESLALGPLETNCHVLRDEGVCWVVDPGMGVAPLVRFLEDAGAEPACILLTHGHGDHIGGVGELKQRYPDARLLCPAGDASMLSDPASNLSGPFGFAITAPAPDEVVEPGQVLVCGRSRWAVLDTSGHTPGGASFHCAEAAVVLTGDSLFAGSIGRTDIPGADTARLLANIRDHLLSLPDETRVLPGHGPETTVGAERRGNPFLFAAASGL